MKASYHQRGLWSIHLINMTSTTLVIDTSPRKIHLSITVNTTQIWKMYPPHQPKSQEKLTGTLGKPSPLTPLQLQNPFPKSCETQKVNPSASPEQESVNLWWKTTSTMLQSYILQQQKEGKKVRQIWQPLCCNVPKNLSMILLRAPEKCKMEGLPSKKRKKNAGARKSKTVVSWLVVTWNGTYAHVISCRKTV